MAHDDWAIRAQATTQREEIQLLRGAVAALRASRAGAAVSARDPSSSARAPTRMTLAIATAFAIGVLVAAAGVALYRTALCP